MSVTCLFEDFKMGSKILHYFVAICILQLKIVSCDQPTATKKPNIIFILVDDLGWNDVSFHGSGQIPTPNIDALAFSGLVLQNYYVTPLCTPSRATLMTGKYAIRTGMQHNVGMQGDKYGLPLSEVTLPQRLKSLGYCTNMVGKWHLGHFNSSYLPNSRGFDSFYGYYSAYTGFYDHLVLDPLTGWTGYDMQDNANADWSSYGAYATDVFSQKSVNIVNAHDASKPLFLYISHLAQHVGNSYASLQAPNASIALFSHIKDPQRRIFAAMLYELDQSIGRLVKALLDKNMLQNTIIVFSTDNGGVPAPLNQNAGSNWPLKGAKNSTWEGGVKGVGVVWSPLLPKNRRGVIYNDLIDLSDWVPTLYEAAGGNTAYLAAMDGISHWDSLLNGTPSKRTSLLHNIDDRLGYAGVRLGNYKLTNGTTYGGKLDVWFGPKGLDNPAPSWSSDSSIYRNQLINSQVGSCLVALNVKLASNLCDMRKNLKVNCNKTAGAVPCNALSGKPCLFDLSVDPCEYNNLADYQPTIVKSLLNLLKQYRAGSVTPLNADLSILRDPTSNPKYWNCTVTNWKDFAFDSSKSATCPQRIM